MNSALTRMRIIYRGTALLKRCQCLNHAPKRLPSRVLTAGFSVSSIHQNAQGDPLPAPTRDDAPIEYSEKISSIVDQIASLTLLEVSELNQLLKERLNIQDAPVMAIGAAAPAAPSEEEEEMEVVAATPQKTSFAVKLTGFDTAQKVKLIKEVKALNTGMNLVQAKKFVESLPQMVKTDIGQDEADKLKEQLEAIGATCEIE